MAVPKSRSALAPQLPEKQQRALDAASDVVCELLVGARLLNMTGLSTRLDRLKLLLWEAGANQTI